MILNINLSLPSPTHCPWVGIFHPAKILYCLSFKHLEKAGTNPSWLGQETGYTLGRSTIYDKVNTEMNRQTVFHTFECQYRVASWPNPHMFGTILTTTPPCSPSFVHTNKIILVCLTYFVKAIALIYIIWFHNSKDKSSTGHLQEHLPLRYTSEHQRLWHKVSPQYNWG